MRQQTVQAKEVYSSKKKFYCMGPRARKSAKMGRKVVYMFYLLDSMVVYVIIGVVGFAAGAGGILWAVCMFIRR